MAVPPVDGLTCDTLTDAAGNPYMRRYYLDAGRLNDRYHCILTNDPDPDFHDHPWDYTTTILNGSYREITPDGSATYTPGDAVFHRATDLHRLEIIDGPVWTHFTTGPFQRTWGYATPQGWIDWRAYRGQPSPPKPRTQPQPTRTKASRHRGQYHRLSQIMNAAANADPTTRCWRDGHTLAQHPGSTWTCGHIEPDEYHLYRKHPSPYATWIDGRLCAPEPSGCNYSAGARRGNNMRRQDTTRNWYRPA